VTSAPPARPPRLRAVVGLGANLGDRLATMRAALEALRARTHVVATSRVYATAPVGPPQPEYLNAAALVEWEGSAEALLDALLAVEGHLGRVRRERNGPRVIDLDVLWVEGLAIEAERLTVPHPRLAERAFALVPLLDVAPLAADPRTGVRYAPPPGDVRLTSHAL
jgi:2-amino-4-hydroxy-6-hydroxymethyldihydropteridine diphosphokinase